MQTKYTLVAVGELGSRTSGITYFSPNSYRYTDFGGDNG